MANLYFQAMRAYIYYALEVWMVFGKRLFENPHQEFDLFFGYCFPWLSCLSFISIFCLDASREFFFTSIGSASAGYWAPHHGNEIITRSPLITDTTVAKHSSNKIYTESGSSESISVKGDVPAMRSDLPVPDASRFYGNKWLDYRVIIVFGDSVIFSSPAILPEIIAFSRAKHFTDNQRILKLMGCAHLVRQSEEIFVYGYNFMVKDGVSCLSNVNWTT